MPENWKLVGEIKYSSGEYAINKEYDRLLRNKIAVFEEAIGNKKTIQTTMSTTYGLRKNKYSNLINTEVVLDDLFAE